MSTATKTAPKVTHEIKTITPEMAEQMLGSGAENRTLRRRVVQKYADDITSGRWQFNGEPIIFNEKDELIDGQHRLSAIVTTGQALPVLVVSGVPHGAMSTIDGGTARNAANQLQFEGIASPAAVAATVRLILWFERGDRWCSRAITNAEIVEWAVAHRDEVVPMANVYNGAIGSDYVGSPASLAAAYYFATQADNEHAVIFFDTILSGEGLYGGDPALSLRKKAATWPGTRQRGEGIAQIAFILKAWNAYAGGHKIRRLDPPSAGWTGQNLPEAQSKRSLEQQIADAEKHPLPQAG